MLSIGKFLILLLGGLTFSGNAHAFMAGAFDGLLTVVGIATGVVAFIIAFLIRRYFWVLRRLADFIAVCGCLVVVLVFYAEGITLTKSHDMWELILPSSIVFLILAYCYWFIPAKRKNPQYSIVQFVVLVGLIAVMITACNYGKRELRVRKYAEIRAKYERQLKQSSAQKKENGIQISDIPQIEVSNERRPEAARKRIRYLPPPPKPPTILIGPDLVKTVKFQGPKATLENKQAE